MGPAQQGVMQATLEHSPPGHDKPGWWAEQRPHTLRGRLGKCGGGRRSHGREGGTLSINMDTQEEEPKVCTTSVIVIQSLPGRNSTILYLAFLEHSTVMVIIG